MIDWNNFPVTFPKTATPWGRADTAYRICRGITVYGTPGHGGVKVSKTLNEKIHPSFQNADGWYEEDCEFWIPVYWFLPSFLVSEARREEVANHLREEFPHKWEAMTGEKVTAEQSSIVAREEFQEANRENYVVTSALGEDQAVRVSAVRRSDGDRKAFLVSHEEYAARGRWGFVVNTEEHLEVVWN